MGMHVACNEEHDKHTFPATVVYPALLQHWLFNIRLELAQEICMTIGCDGKISPSELIMKVFLDWLFLILSQKLEGLALKQTCTVIQKLEFHSTVNDWGKVSFHISNLKVLCALTQW